MEEKIIIPAEMLREGYIAMDRTQRAKFMKLVDPFTGECNKSDLQMCYKEVCSEWRGKLEKQFSWLKEPEKLNIRKMINDGSLFCTPEHPGTSGIIQLSCGGEYEGVSLYLSELYNWEIKKDNREKTVLIPTKK